jgi:hypothetical protein
MASISDQIFACFTKDGERKLMLTNEGFEKLEDLFLDQIESLPLEPLLAMWREASALPAKLGARSDAKISAKEGLEDAMERVTPALRARVTALQNAQGQAVERQSPDRRLFGGASPSVAPQASSPAPAGSRKAADFAPRRVGR